MRLAGRAACSDYAAKTMKSSLAARHGARALRAAPVHSRSFLTGAAYNLAKKAMPKMSETEKVRNSPPPCRPTKNHLSSWLTIVFPAPGRPRLRHGRLRPRHLRRQPVAQAPGRHVPAEAGGGGAVVPRQRGGDAVQDARRLPGDDGEGHAGGGVGLHARQGLLRDEDPKVGRQGLLDAHGVVGAR